jgi:hypothetical protein
VSIVVEKSEAELLEKRDVAELATAWNLSAVKLDHYWMDTFWSEEHDDRNVPEPPVSIDDFEQITQSLVRRCGSMLQYVDTTPLVEFFMRASALGLTFDSRRFDKGMTALALAEIPFERPRLPRLRETTVLPYGRSAAVIQRILILLDSDMVRLQPGTVVSVDRQTNSVRIVDDDTHYKVDPHLALMLDLLVFNKKAGVPYTTGTDLEDLAGCTGKNISREINRRLKSSVPPLEEIIGSNDNGYFLKK